MRRNSYFSASCRPSWKASRVSKPEAGHFAKAGVEAGKGLWEFRPKVNVNFEIGKELNVESFNDIKKVDITGFSKGKGFQGTIKRWNFRAQDKSHGNSLSHRAPGSISQCQTPGRVFRGKKMSGHMGSKRTTTHNLEVVRIDTERNLVLVNGAVPGSKGASVVIKPAIKA